jgi:hypothetical protein
MGDAHPSGSWHRVEEAMLRRTLKENPLKRYANVEERSLEKTPYRMICNERPHPYSHKTVITLKS